VGIAEASGTDQGDQGVVVPNNHRRGRSRSDPLLVHRRRPIPGCCMSCQHRQFGVNGRNSAIMKQFSSCSPTSARRVVLDTITELAPRIGFGKYSKYYEDVCGRRSRTRVPASREARFRLKGHILDVICVITSRKVTWVAFTLQRITEKDRDVDVIRPPGAYTGSAKGKPTRDPGARRPSISWNREKT